MKDKVISEIIHYLPHLIRNECTNVIITQSKLFYNDITSPRQMAIILNMLFKNKKDFANNVIRASSLKFKNFKRKTLRKGIIDNINIYYSIYRFFFFKLKRYDAKLIHQWTNIYIDTILDSGTLFTELCLFYDKCISILHKN